jgi:CRP-like cAMP-binding protein
MRVAPIDVPPFAAFAAQVPLLAGLPDAAELERAAEPFALALEQALFVQNDPADGAYLIASGSLRIAARTPGDGERVLAEVGPGGLTGELCLLDGGRRSAEARASTTTTGYRIDYERFAGLRAGGSAAADALLQRLRAEVARRAAATLTSMDDAGSERSDPTSTPDYATIGPEEAARLLQWFPGFARFAPSDWDAFAASARSFAAPRGTLLAAPASERGELLVVARGALRETLGARQMIVHGPGRIANAAAVVAGGAWPTALVVREDALLYAIPADAALSPRLTDMLGLQLTRDLRRLTRERNRGGDPALETA